MQLPPERQTQTEGLLRCDSESRSREILFRSGRTFLDNATEPTGRVSFLGRTARENTYFCVASTKICLLGSSIPLAARH
jgi:hypothetical protein